MNPIEKIYLNMTDTETSKIKKITLYRNLPNPNLDEDRDDHQSNCFHEDNFLLTGLRVFIYLTDNVNKDTGAFRYHDKNHSKYLFRTFGQKF